ncbi:histidine kinase [Haloferula sp. BvORR071]|uniref:sensor histidine kinase n=1 Tax=Haloferula sp. BvORR071 TaxID=1396141 RepID=UPI000552A5CD|nr:histidine kinase [Haloferula sp. BvORR071]
MRLYSNLTAAVRAALLLLSCIQIAVGAPDATSIKLFVDHSPTPLQGPNITVPNDASTLTFFVTPRVPLVRYKLEGIDHDWTARTDEMFFMLRFLNERGDQLSQLSFPVGGRSKGWKGAVEKSDFGSRKETFGVPADAVYLSVAMTSAGPPSLVGVFAVSAINIKSVGDAASPPRVLMSDSQPVTPLEHFWIKSGTHPSMAYDLNHDQGKGGSPVLVIMDDDLTGHADWASDIHGLPRITPGEVLEVQWQETYSVGAGGTFSTTYERLPPGPYRFVVEDLTITGDRLGTTTAISVFVPRPYWKSFWFWGIVAASITILSTLVGRQLIRRKIRRHLQEAQMISDERLRIARDLHDDLGTRLSHISLLGAYGEGNSGDDEARSSFRQITAMSRELIGALSETVWMLNPKNNDFEALVDFLCRLVSELCRLAEIRCRIDAMSVFQNMAISHEFRHNVSLAVKETINNALKHSHATEIKMTIRLDENVLKIIIADNGVGITRDRSKTGLGLESISQRMASIRGRCNIRPLGDDGLEISLEAPLV